MVLITEPPTDTTVAVRLLPSGEGYICSRLFFHDINDVCSGLGDPNHNDDDRAADIEACRGRHPSSLGAWTDVTHLFYDDPPGNLRG